jgi:hypothetical protein
MKIEAAIATGDLYIATDVMRSLCGWGGDSA